jgi:hypothetical protein
MMCRMRCSRTWSGSSAPCIPQLSLGWTCCSSSFLFLFWVSLCIVLSFPLACVPTA